MNKYRRSLLQSLNELAELFIGHVQELGKFFVSKI